MCPTPTTLTLTLQVIDVPHPDDFIAATATGQIVSAAQRSTILHFWHGAGQDMASSTTVDVSEWGALYTE